MSSTNQDRDQVLVHRQTIPKMVVASFWVRFFTDKHGCSSFDCSGVLANYREFTIFNQIQEFFFPPISMGKRPLSYIHIQEKTYKIIKLPPKTTCG